MILRQIENRLHLWGRFFLANGRRLMCLAVARSGKESLVISLLDGAIAIFTKSAKITKNSEAPKISRTSKLSASRKPLLIEAIQRSPKTAQQFADPEGIRTIRRYYQKLR